jgi:hypothetical protein
VAQKREHTLLPCARPQQLPTVPKTAAPAKPGLHAATGANVERHPRTVASGAEPWASDSHRATHPEHTLAELEKPSSTSCEVTTGPSVPFSTRQSPSAWQYAWHPTTGESGQVTVTGGW